MASQIRFEPDGVEGLVASGTTLADAAERLGARVDLACGGRGECDSCAVVVNENPLSLSPLTEAEHRRLAEERIVNSTRLCCQARMGEGDVVVRILSAGERESAPRPEGEATGGGTESGSRAEAASARARLRETFAGLPTSERLAALAELQIRAASDIVESIVEVPLRVGEQFIDSLFGSRGKRGDAPPSAPEDASPNRPDEGRETEEAPRHGDE